MDMKTEDYILEYKYMEDLLVLDIISKTLNNEISDKLKKDILDFVDEFFAVQNELLKFELNLIKEQREYYENRNKRNNK